MHQQSMGDGAALRDQRPAYDRMHKVDAKASSRVAPQESILSQQKSRDRFFIALQTKYTDKGV